MFGIVFKLIIIAASLNVIESTWGLHGNYFQSHKTSYNKDSNTFRTGSSLKHPSVTNRNWNSWGNVKGLGSRPSSGSSRSRDLDGFGIFKQLKTSNNNRSNWGNFERSGKGKSRDSSSSNRIRGVGGWFFKKATIDNSERKSASVTGRPIDYVTEKSNKDWNILANKGDDDEGKSFTSERSKERKKNVSSFKTKSSSKSDKSKHSKSKTSRKSHSSKSNYFENKTSHRSKQSSNKNSNSWKNKGKNDERPEAIEKSKEKQSDNSSSKTKSSSKSDKSKNSKSNSSEKSYSSQLKKLQRKSSHSSKQKSSTLSSGKKYSSYKYDSKHDKSTDISLSSKSYGFLWSAKSKSNGFLWPKKSKSNWFPWPKKNKNNENQWPPRSKENKINPIIPPRTGTQSPHRIVGKTRDTISTTAGNGITETTAEVISDSLTIKQRTTVQTTGWNNITEPTSDEKGATEEATKVNHSTEPKTTGSKPTTKEMDMSEPTTQDKAISESLPEEKDITKPTTEEFVPISDEKEDLPTFGPTLRPPYKGPKVCQKQTPSCCVGGQLTVDLSKGKKSKRGIVDGVTLLQVTKGQGRNKRQACSSTALVVVNFDKIDSTGCFGCLEAPYCGKRILKIELHLSNARRSGWLFNVGDSESNNGYRGDDNAQINDAETQGLFPNITVYPSDKCPSIKSLMHIVDAVANDVDSVTLYISNEHIRITNSEGLDFKLCHACLYALNGQPDEGPKGVPNETICIGLNRVVKDLTRSGYGVCSATFSWECPWCT